MTVLFCLIDDAYASLDPRGRRYESLKRLSGSEAITLALFQQLRGVESERSSHASGLRPSLSACQLDVGWLDFGREDCAGCRDRRNAGLSGR
ncbi:hypothetical protein GBA63_15555 [Rubrobacter tropicus]|uniref:Uncharacterized protein n=1 Tax=Rubrobacter tropicus TaxID=2653851 RepID=A0A6G8QBN7_9ACTN|nr:hypothetical protein GBA63_15555 [Rubrobacter tropicus]